jgi:hypothetical protein
VQYFVVWGHIVRPGGPRTIIAQPMGFATRHEARRAAEGWGFSHPYEIIEAPDRETAIVLAAQSRRPYAAPMPPDRQAAGHPAARVLRLLRRRRGWISRLREWWRRWSSVARGPRPAHLGRGLSAGTRH